MKTVDQNTIIELIKEDNPTFFQSYIVEKKINLKEFNNGRFDILIFAIEQNASVPTLKIILQQCQYETLNYTIYDENDNDSYNNNSDVNSNSDDSNNSDNSNKDDNISNDSNNSDNSNNNDNINDDYIIHYKVPLFTAIYRERLDTAHFLRRYGAEMNYQMRCRDNRDGKETLKNVIQYLFDLWSLPTLPGRPLPFLNKKVIEFIVKGGFYWKGLDHRFLEKIIEEYQNDTLELILRHYLFDPPFILSLLNFYRNRNALTAQELETILIAEKTKIDLTDTVYETAIQNQNDEAIRLLIVYDPYPSDHILKRLQQSEIFEMAIKKKNELLVKKILALPNFEYETALMEKMLVKAIEKRQLGILRCLMRNFSISTTSNTTTATTTTTDKFTDMRRIDIEKILLVASQQNDIETLKYFMNGLLNFSSKAIEILDLTSFKTYDTRFLILIINIAIKIGNLHRIKSIMDSEVFKPILDIYARDKNDECPILTAFDRITSSSSDNDIKIFDYLLGHGDISGTNYYYGRYLFCSAINCRKYLAVNCLFKQGISIEMEEDEEEDEEYSSTSSPTSSLTSSPKDCHHPLLQAIYKNDLKGVEKFLRDATHQLTMCMGISSLIIYSSNYGFTPLILAYLLNHSSIVDLLLSYSDINELDANGYSILHYAILKEDLTSTRKLVALGADVNFNENKNGRGNSALDIAICMHHKPIFKTLLTSSNLQLNRTNEWGVTPLMTIIDMNQNGEEEEEGDEKEKEKEKGKEREKDKLEMIQDLIDRGANVNFIDIFGNTPLTWAIRKRFLPVIRLLIEHGADWNYRIEDRHHQQYSSQRQQHLYQFQHQPEKHPTSHNPLKGKSLLMYAIELGEMKIINYLIECSRDRVGDKEDDYGLDAFDVIEAVERNGQPEVLKYLIQAYPQKPIVMEFIEKMIFLNKIDLLKYLMEERVLDLNQKDQNGDSPMVYAIKHSRVSIVNYFLDHSADWHHINQHYGESLEALSAKIYDVRYNNCDYYREKSSQTIYRRIKRILEKRNPPLPLPHHHHK